MPGRSVFQSWGLWLVFAAAVAVLAAASLAAGLITADLADQDASNVSPAAERGHLAFQEATGLEVLLVALTGDGGMLDVRYRVLNPDKAALVHGADTPMTIVHEPTGKVANKPWMQHSKGKRLNIATTYYEMLWNPARTMRRGDPVTVAIGDYRLEHVIVQ